MSEIRFYRKILEAPADPEAWLALAEWFTEVGDPRGELIQVQIELRSTDVTHREELETSLIALQEIATAPATAILKHPSHVEFALIPPGAFLMGSPISDRCAIPHEKPQHRVTISRPFVCSRQLVTQSFFEEIMCKNPSTFGGPDHPVDAVTWFDAIEFCNRLSELECIPNYYKIGNGDVEILGGEGYRLPTEAEWEYACRAGTSTQFCFGDSETKLTQYGHFLKKTWFYRLLGAGWYGYDTKPCGLKRANSWGLYDMHGNVWEWCQDWYANYSENVNTVNPIGPADGQERVMRGGGFFTLAADLRSASRFPCEPAEPAWGFRLAKDYCSSTSVSKHWKQSEKLL